MVDDGTALFFERYRRKTHVTPRSYLGFIELYREVYKKKVSHVEELASSINNGLLKLEQASADVDLMKIEVRDKEKVIAVAVAATRARCCRRSPRRPRAEKKKSEVQVIVDAVAVEAETIGKDKDAVEEDHAAKPALDDAENALPAITGKDIGMLKALKKPPELIKRLFDCVLVLFQEPLIVCEAVMVKRLQLEVSWERSTQVMSQSNFPEQLQLFDKDGINDETIELLYPVRERRGHDVRRRQEGVGQRRRAVHLGQLDGALHAHREDGQAEDGRAQGRDGQAQRGEREARGRRAARRGQGVARQDAGVVRRGDREEGAIEADALAQRRMDSANKLIGALGGEYALEGRLGGLRR